MNNKYQNSKIYKIIDIGYNSCYIGSTCQQLSNRMSGHRCSYRKYLKNPMEDYISSFFLFEQYGIENCKIELIEHYPCNTKEELFKREGFYIQETDCVNKHIAGRTRQEWSNENREKLNKQLNDINKRLRKEHPERFKEYDRKRREKHCEAMRERRLEKYPEIKDERNERRKANYQSNIVDCACGGRYSKCVFRRHEKSNRHQAYLQSLDD